MIKLNGLGITKIRHIEIKDIKTQLEAPHRRIKRSGLVEATIFPQSVQGPEFILIIAKFYDPNTR